MGDGIVLTDEERRIILQLRRDDEERAQMLRLQLRRLKAAHEFAVWLDENGAGSTFSTFCNDFGYEADDGESRSVTYDVVHQIMKVAKGGM